MNANQLIEYLHSRGEIRAAEAVVELATQRDHYRNRWVMMAKKASVPISVETNVSPRDPFMGSYHHDSEGRPLTVDSEPAHYDN